MFYRQDIFIVNILILGQDTNSHSWVFKKPIFMILILKESLIFQYRLPCTNILFYYCSTIFFIYTFPFQYCTIRIYAAIYSDNRPNIRLSIFSNLDNSFLLLTNILEHTDNDATHAQTKFI